MSYAKLIGKGVFTMYKKYNLNDFTISQKELKDRVNNYDSLKQEYKQSSNQVINADKIKVAFSEAVRNGK